MRALKGRVTAAATVGRVNLRDTRGRRFRADDEEGYGEWIDEVGRGAEGCTKYLG